MIHSSPKAGALLRLCLAPCFGVIAAFSMPDVSFWPALFIGLSGLYVLYSQSATMLRAWFSGFLFGLGYFVTGLWWIGNALLVEGNEFAWVWPISVIGLPTLLSLFTATYLSIARKISNPQKISGFFIFSLFLTFSEWTRGNAFTGFPWNLYGYAWSEHMPMAQMSFYIGAYGLTFLSVLWAASAGFILTSPFTCKKKLSLAAAVVVLLALCFTLGSVRLSRNNTLLESDSAVIVVQPNIPQNMKWDPAAVQDNFVKSIRMSRDALVEDKGIKNIFIVWPETAISPTVYTVNDNMEMIRDTLQSYRPARAYLVTGVLRQIANPDGAIDFTNSVVALNDQLTSVDIYDKTHLVPFGEFIPLQDWIPLKPVAAFKGFVRGEGPKTVSDNDIPTFSPLICYEIIFPNEIVSRKNVSPDWIVNVTNDGWYGDSAGPHQHFAQTRMRAIEEGLPVIRSANTGISGVIDPYGRVLEQANIFSTETLFSYLPAKIENPYGAVRTGLAIIMLLTSLFLMIQNLLFPKSQD